MKFREHLKKHIYSWILIAMVLQKPSIDCRTVKTKCTDWVLYSCKIIKWTWTNHDDDDDDDDDHHHHHHQNQHPHSLISFFKLKHNFQQSYPKRIDQFEVFALIRKYHESRVSRVNKRDPKKRISKRIPGIVTGIMGISKSYCCWKKFCITWGW